MEPVPRPQSRAGRPASQAEADRGPAQHLWPGADAILRLPLCQHRPARGAARAVPGGGGGVAAMILVTGAAGFIGYHVCLALLARGEEVLGIDNLNSYYSPSLKESRLALLVRHNGFAFRPLDISNPELVLGLGTEPLSAVIHLAAQAGVRYSLENPFAYVQANVMGQVAMLELARRLDGLGHFVYASSSSVYGGNTKVPFDIADDVGRPQSLYAATKRADELIAQTYAHLYGLPC